MAILTMVYSDLVQVASMEHPAMVTLSKYIKLFGLGTLGLGLSSICIMRYYKYAGIEAKLWPLTHDNAILGEEASVLLQLAGHLDIMEANFDA